MPEVRAGKQNSFEFPRSLLDIAAFIPAELARQLPYAICKYLKAEQILYRGATLNLLSCLGGFKSGK